MSYLWPVLGLLAILGILDTIYVLRFTFAPAPIKSANSAAACSLEDPAACQTLFKSPTAHLIGGIPNSALGFVFYGLILLTSGLHLAQIPLPGWWIGLLILGAIAAVAMSLFLAYNLIFVRRTTCIPCFIGQGLNVLLLIGLVLSLNQRA